MKRYAAIYFGMISVFFAIVKSEAQSTDSTLNTLLAIDENQFINKPLDSIISVFPCGYIEIKIVAGGHRYTARKLRIRYSNEVWIELHVREFNFMNPVDTNRGWNIPLIRQEKLYRTVIYKNVDCYRNCDVR
jgi:hypothetical protein